MSKLFNKAPALPVLLVALVSVAPTPSLAIEFEELTKVYGIIKPERISTSVAVNNGIATSVLQVGSVVQAGATLASVMEKELTRTYRASISGVVSKVHITEGAALTPGMPLVTIMDPSLKQIEVSLSPSEAKEVKRGTKVMDQAGQQLGQIDKISPLVDPDTGAVVSYMKASKPIAESIGDVIPMYVLLRKINDCDEVLKISSFDSTQKNVRVIAQSGDKVCVKKISAQK